MKILVLTNLYPPDVIGGYELGCRQVVDALIDRGHDVRVLTTAPRTPAPHVPHVARELRLSEVWNDYMFQHSQAGHRPRLLDAESNLDQRDERPRPDPESSTTSSPTSPTSGTSWASVGLG